MGRELEGKVAVVTGAGRGIGRSYAQLLAERGAAVVVNDLGAEADGSGASRAPAEEIVDEIRRAGGIAIADANSVATAEGVQRLVASAIGEFGRVDILIHKHLGKGDYNAYWPARDWRDGFRLCAAPYRAGPPGRGL